MSRTTAISKYVLAIFMIGAGTMHFVNPGFFLKIMPPYLPLHEELVLMSGVFEVLLGALLLIPQCSRLSAWGIIALLIAVFPANLYLYQHHQSQHRQHERHGQYYCDYNRREHHEPQQLAAVVQPAPLRLLPAPGRADQDKSKHHHHSASTTLIITIIAPEGHDNHTVA